VTIDPASGATVTVAGVEYTESTSSIPVEAPGVYEWSAVAADGFEIEGASSGEVEIEDCKRPEPKPVTVVVTGECIRDGNFARIDIDMDPDGGAEVVLTAPDQSVQELTGDAAVDGALGTWTYTSSAADGYALTDGAEGSVDVRSCKRTTSTTEPKEPQSALGDLVWFDENQNGRQDGGGLEFPIQGATVSLLAPDGTVLEDQVTGPDGLYLFDELDAGNYRVRVCLQGADFTVENALGVADDVDSDVFVLGNGCAMTGLINLPAGVTDLTWDAGVVVEVKGIQVEPTTTTTPPPIEPVTVETLPFTGVETEQTVLVALGALLAGAALLFVVSRRDDAVVSTMDGGTSWSNRRS
jgi:LPXTG-motif cell wall-anchored protein